MVRPGWLVLAVSMLVGCGGDELVSTDAENEAALAAWVNFEDAGCADCGAAALGSASRELGGRVPPEVTMVQRHTGFGYLDVAVRVSRIPDCAARECFYDRRCFGFEGYYKADGRLWFEYASQNPNHGGWSLFGSTPSGSQWLDDDGYYHFRVGGVSIDAVDGLDAFPRLFMLHFSDQAPGAGVLSEVLHKRDNTEDTGWCLFDGTGPAELVVFGSDDDW